MIRKILCGRTPDEIHQLISAYGFNLSHAILVAKNLYRKRIAEIPQFRGIPKELIKILCTVTSAGIYSPVRSDVSADETIKYLFRNPGGKEFETVYIPDKKRHTVCVSAQSGCRMGCPFCATGRYGFHGNLSAGDILNQIISLPEAGKITHVVFMGMGEPMDNLENVLKASGIITAEWGMAISPRNITVSTVGITPGIRLFLEQSDCNLAISLFSPIAGERLRVIPVEKRYPVREIIEMMKDYPAGKKRRFSIAYVMIRNVNDSDIHLEELKTILTDSKIRVNLLPYHPAKDDSFVSSSEERMFYFKHNLVISGISASVRRSRGADISAACGLLASCLGKEY